MQGAQCSNWKLVHSNTGGFTSSAINDPENENGIFKVTDNGANALYIWDPGGWNSDGWDYSWNTHSVRESTYPMCSSDGGAWIEMWDKRGGTEPTLVGNHNAGSPPNGWILLHQGATYGVNGAQHPCDVPGTLQYIYVCTDSAPATGKLYQDGVPLSFVPFTVKAERLLVLPFNGTGSSPTAVAYDSRLAEISLTEFGTALSVTQSNGAGGTADGYAQGWSLSTYFEDGNYGNGVAFSSYDDSWYVNNNGEPGGARTWIAWYKGGTNQRNADLNNAAAGPVSCGVSIFGDPDAQTSYLSLGVEAGRVAVCAQGGQHRGASQVADNSWHMLAWGTTPPRLRTQPSLPTPTRRTA
jgi:hypothetical protein